MDVDKDDQQIVKDSNTKKVHGIFGTVNKFCFNRRQSDQNGAMSPQMDIRKYPKNGNKSLK